MEQLPAQSVQWLDYRLEHSGIVVQFPARARDCVFSKFPKPALWRTQSPIQWLPGTLFLGEGVCRYMKLTADLHLVLRIRTSTAECSSPPSPAPPYGVMSGTDTNLTSSYHFQRRIVWTGSVSTKCHHNVLHRKAARSGLAPSAGNQ